MTFTKSLNINNFTKPKATNMSSGIYTTIKIKPYLKEFILCRFLNNRFQASADDALGTTIKPFLISSPCNLIKLEADENDNYFTFELPNYSDKKVIVFNYIDPRSQKYIEEIFELLFREAMFHHVQQNLELNGGLIKDWIINWCRFNNITFSKVNYETLKKAFYRYRMDQENKEKNEKINTRLLPSISPRYHFIVPCKSQLNTDVENELEPLDTLIK